MSSPLRVLHVLGGDGTGGCERLTLDLVRWMAERGIDQRVLFFAEESQSFAGPASATLRELQVPIHGVVLGRGRRLSFVRGLARLCRETQRNAVVTHAWGNHAFVAMGARLGGVRRTVVLIQNPPPSSRAMRWKSALLGHLGRPFVAAEVACSEHVAGLATRAYGLRPGRIVVIPNWCDARGIRDRAAAARRKRDGGDAAVRLVMVGRFDPIKDQATVVRAFAAFARDVPGARLTLVGDGPTKAAVAQLAAGLSLGQQVELPGSRGDVPEILGQMDMFVFGTTVDEGFGIVLIEAMAAGLPVVCSDVGPCREVLGEAGCLVPPRPDAMGDALREVWSEPERRRRMAAAGEARALARYDVGAVAPRLLPLLEGCAPGMLAERERMPA